MKTISQKKGFFAENQFWPFFSRIIEYGRPQVTNFGAPVSVLEITLRVIRSFP